jgi:hypothetical protein
MKKIFITIAFISFATQAMADEYVNGYTRSNGTYVESYHRTVPDGNPYNNYSTQGNTNPYTGEQGHVNPNNYNNNAYNNYNSYNR